jgi:hypothetical protein
LNSAQDAYEEACNALRLRSVLPAITVHPDATTLPVEPTALTNDEEDDTSWFFDSAVGAVAAATAGEYCEDQLTDTLRSPTGAAGSYSTAQELQILQRGLQHCLPHEFELLYIPPGVTAYSVNDTMNKSISLPMRLAGGVVQHLWPQRSGSSLSVTGLGLNFSTEQYMHVRRVAGLPAYRSMVLPSSLVLDCEVRDFDRAAWCRCGPLIPAGRISRIVFKRIAVVLTSLGLMSEAFTEDNAVLGNSQQARSVRTQRVLRPEEYIDSLRERSNGSSNVNVQRICVILRELNVELLICEKAMATASLVDRLSNAGIAVLGVGSAKELRSAAALSGATAVEDASCLSEGDIGCVALELKYLHELPAYSTQGVSTADTGWRVDLAGAERSNEVDGTLELGDGRDQQSQCLVALSRFGSECNDFGAASSSVSVNICAPTEMMAVAHEDRFSRCLHRLRWALEGRSSPAREDASGCDASGVMPGAGVAELLCQLRLNEIVSQLSAQGAEDDAVWEQIEVLRIFDRMLGSYMRQIMVNNAYSYAAAEERIHWCTEFYRARLSGSASVLDAVRGMSDSDKQALPPPIDLSLSYGCPDLTGVLDLVDVKAAAVGAASLLVMQML